MLNILLIIILSPVALICGIISIAIIYGILDYIIKLILNTADAISNAINKKDNK